MLAPPPTVGGGARKAVQEKLKYGIRQRRKIRVAMTYDDQRGQSSR